MTIEELKNAIAIFYPALVLDRILGRETRNFLATLVNIFLIISFILTVTASAAILDISWSSDILPLIKMLQLWRPVFIGALFVALSFWLVALAFKAFYDSYYFRGLQTVLPEPGLSGESPKITFEAAEVLISGIHSGDLSAAFVRSRLGEMVFYRLAISDDEITKFLSGRNHLTELGSFKPVPDTGSGRITFRELASAVVGADAELLKFLATHTVSVKDFVGASDWVARIEAYSRKRDRFWGRDSLGRIPGIGKNWAYGGAYTLEKFAHDVTERSGSDLEEVDPEKNIECEKLEAILARSGEANALLVADEKSEALEVVFALGGQITQGSVLPPLEHKRVFLFDTNAFIAAAKEKSVFESLFLRIISESIRAGNIILVMADFPSFIESAKSIGSDAVSLMDQYLASRTFQVIAIADIGSYNQNLAADSKVLHRFEKLMVKERSERATLEILENQALFEEAKNRIFFTFQSLSAVAEGAKRYFSEGAGSDKALDLLSEVVPAVLTKKKTIVEKADVLRLIESKTGIPTGEVAGAEREKLLNLEDILHQRIIGQEEAIKTISNAMRRARSDIENPERPMGSFLFLGPTGVGKTETSKALASIFFGKEDSIIRLDMSEYRTADALNRLIGSFEGGKAGVLASKLREQPYGVLLLDEFEKTNKEVLDLFLQILDEGFFSDMSGKRVNARNLIIIATSNAGSNLIWNLMRSGKNLADSKDEIIIDIINKDIFKPELLNRFDGVVLFHPLSAEELQKIAVLMLKKLQKRLMLKGMELVINDALIQAVMAAGMDPQFGARPMNRAIQEKVEQVIARKIIEGSVVAGSRIELTAAELV